MTSLDDPKINNILNSLHEESKKDFWKLNKFGFFRLLEILTGNKNDFSKDPQIKANAFKNIYIVSDRKLLFFLIRDVYE